MEYLNKAYRFIWVWLTLILSVWLAWHLLAKVDFLYPVWYDHGGIAQHIDQFAPQNRFRQDFEQTDRATRLELFHGIVESIHRQGNGLEQLHYQNAYGKIPLLHRAEMVHLQDVAHLIDFLNRLAVSLGIIWIMLTSILLLRQSPFPSLKWTGMNLGLGLGLALSALFSLGAEKVFYQFHIWIFPPGHQWFFYYQDSLMSTMMKAPDLFGMIAASLLAVALLIFFSFQTLFYKLTCNWQ